MSLISETRVLILLTAVQVVLTAVMRGDARVKLSRLYCPATDSATKKEPRSASSGVPTTERSCRLSRSPGLRCLQYTAGLRRFQRLTVFL